MLKPFLAALAATATLLCAAPAASAVVVDAINENASIPHQYTWQCCNVGWVYTPDSSYTLTGIGTKFGSGGADVFGELYSGTPLSGLTLLRSGALTPVADTFANYFFAPIAISSGTTYFVGFKGVTNLTVNVTDDAGAATLPQWGDSGFGNYAQGGFEQGLSAQPILRFLGEEVAVSAIPEPSTWALLILGFGSVGFAMRRRRAAVVYQEIKRGSV